MTGKELAAELACRLGKSQDEASQIIACLTDIIEHEVSIGNSVAIRGFGKFQQRRVGKPIAKQELDKNFPDALLMTVSFRPGINFKQRIRGQRRLKHIPNVNLPPEKLRELMASIDPERYGSS